jgi:hypothetical protein
MATIPLFSFDPVLAHGRILCLFISPELTVGTFHASAAAIIDFHQVASTGGEKCGHRGSGEFRYDEGIVATVFLLGELHFNQRSGE